ncbi:hypothetical protein HF521_005860 [Silurus meridionalis]|uniref:Interleukin-4 n=1 Tax=Silurus meridionalis TaxID=175797 RepID=A0A8T0B047_SILME|nr:hypothetical protein HF521_005860 [Silurus meridionalis]
MKAVILLLVTAAAFNHQLHHNNLRSAIPGVDCLHKKTLNSVEFDSVFVKDLKQNRTDSCETKFFCQAEKVLSAVQKLPEGCNIDNLLRNLKQIGKEKNCTVPKKGDEILLRSFLDDILKCSKKVFSTS